MPFNLLRVSQLYDVVYKVEFNSTQYLVKHSELNITKLVGYMKENIYQVNLHGVTNLFIKYFVSKEEET